MISCDIFSSVLFSNVYDFYIEHVVSTGDCMQINVYKQIFGDLVLTVMFPCEILESCTVSYCSRISGAKGADRMAK